MKLSRLLTCTLFIICCQVSTADIYKTVDKNGNPVFTNLPNPNSNAKVIDIKPTNTVPSTPQLPPQDNNTTHQQPVEYQLQITSPQQGTIIPPDQGSIAVAIAFGPAVESDIRFNYKLDGAVKVSTADYIASLENIPRGEHDISVEAVNGEGEILAQSESISIIAQRPVIKQKPTPAAQK